MYFTVSKVFCKRVEKIMMQRKNKIGYYINRAENFVNQGEAIKRKMVLLKRSFNEQTIITRKLEREKTADAESLIKNTLVQRQVKLKEDHKLVERNIAESFQKKLHSQRLRMNNLIENYLIR